MEEGQPFVDYYSVLGVGPECNARTLDIAYRQLAKMYHPDHPESADLDRFNSITEAYSLLRKPHDRSAYNRVYARNTGYSFKPKEAKRAEGLAAVSDAKMHADILMFLYKKRRACTGSPGAGSFDILRNLVCSDENFEFHAWYLKKKGFIESLDDGTYAITVDGVDHVISMSQVAENMLRITQSDDSDAEPWDAREVAGGTMQ